MDANRTLQTTDFVGNYTLRYNAVDAAGNAVREITCTVEVVDRNAPVIILNGPLQAHLNVGDPYK